MPTRTKHKYGQIIENLNCPLFSNKIAELKALNEKLLAAMSEAVQKDKVCNTQDEAKITRKKFFNVQ